MPDIALDTLNLGDADKVLRQFRRPPPEVQQQLLDAFSPFTGVGELQTVFSVATFAHAVLMGADTYAEAFERLSAVVYILAHRYYEEAYGCVTVVDG